MIRALVLLAALSGPALADPITPYNEADRTGPIASSGQIAAQSAPRPDSPERFLAIAHRRTSPDGADLRRSERVPRRERVCGSRRLRGKAAPTIPADLPGCGLRGGVRLLSVDGVALSRPAVMDCSTAKALERWVRKGLKPAVGRMGGGVARLEVAAHYVCRTRNHRPGAPISEHGKGKAIDISAITLANGQQLNVQSDWGRGKKGRILKRAHRKACGPFGTVLGPEADRHHRNHFHFDTARHRGGPYCR